MANPSVTWTFSNGTASDATKVNTNFTDIINALTDGTKTLTLDDVNCADLSATGNSTLGDTATDTLTVNASIAAALVFTQISTPSNPASGATKLYVKSDDHAYVKTSGGNEIDVGLPAGAIVPYGGTSAPTGWLLCNGATVSRTTYANLFTAISTAFGNGDGATTFHLPDLRGRFIRGTDGATARDPDAGSRTAMNTGGNTGDNVGSIQANATKLPVTSFTTGNQSASHTHSGTTSSDGSHTHNSGVSFYRSGGAAYASLAAGAADSFTLLETTGAHTHTMTTGNQSASHTHTVTSGGDNESRPINAYVNFIIKW